MKSFRIREFTPFLLEADRRLIEVAFPSYCGQESIPAMMLQSRLEPWGFGAVESDVSVVMQVAPVAIPGLSVRVSANRKYFVTFRGVLDNLNNSSPGWKFALSGPAGSGSYVMEHRVAALCRVPGSWSAVYQGPDQISPTNGFFTACGVIEPATNGVVELLVAQNSPDINPVTVRAGTFLEVCQLTYPTELR